MKLTTPVVVACSVILARVAAASFSTAFHPPTYIRERRCSWWWVLIARIGPLLIAIETGFVMRFKGLDLALSEIATNRHSQAPTEFKL